MPQSNLKTAPVQDHQGAIDKLVRAQFNVAAQEAAHRVVDLSQIGAKPVAGMPSALRTEVHIDNYADGATQFTMEFMDAGHYFGSITASMRVENGKIRLSQMQYDARGMKGFAPYAVRHLVSVFRDVHHLVIATGVMADPDKIRRIKDEDRPLVEKMELGKLKLFEWLGFQLLDAQTHARIVAPETVADLRACRAEFAFDNQETRDAVFKALGLPADNHAASVIELPVRQAHELREQIQQVAVASR